MLRTLFIGTVLVVAGGCATTDSLRPGAGGSTFEVRDRSYDDIWKAAVRTLSRNLVIVESNKDAGSIKAEARMALNTWGEVVGVFIQPPRSGEKSYVVEVQSLKRHRLQVSGQDWTVHVIEGIRSDLDEKAP